LFRKVPLHGRRARVTGFEASQKRKKEAGRRGAHEAECRLMREPDYRHVTDKGLSAKGLKEDAHCPQLYFGSRGDVTIH